MYTHIIQGYVLGRRVWKLNEICDAVWNVKRGEEAGRAVYSNYHKYI